MGRWSLPCGDHWFAPDADRFTVIRFRPSVVVGIFTRRSLGGDGSDGFGVWSRKETGPEHVAMLRPGWSSRRLVARSGHEHGTPTALLDHREHAGDEREGARARGGIDLGDGSEDEEPADLASWKG